MKKRPTQARVARFYGLDPKTLRNYKNGSIEEQRRYRALMRYYEEESQSPSDIKAEICRLLDRLCENRGKAKKEMPVKMELLTPEDIPRYVEQNIKDIASALSRLPS